MVAHIRRALVMSVFCLIFFGFVYAFVGTGVAQVLFKHQADGSITSNGSTAIGQRWTGRRWFHGRPDDEGPYAHTTKKNVTGGDNPLVATGVAGESGATNLGPRSQTLVTDTKAMVAYWHRLGVPHPTNDLVTTSGSGLTADITPQDALVQVTMVHRATRVTVATLKALISRETHGAQLGFLGSSYVVVLTLNEGLSKLEQAHGR
jgi:potassium-transporting ATPase KdpC subunit